MASSELSKQVKKGVQAISELRNPELVREVVSQLMTNTLFKDTLLASLGISALHQQIQSLENRLEDMEQYSRRNCLKFRGIPETEGESTDQLVVNTCNESLGVMVTEADISRSHRVGPMNKNYPRDIIVRFLSYRTRANVYSARFSLFSAQSDQPSESTSPPKHKIYINEALTKARSAVFNKARFLKNQGHVSGAWTQDGRIVIRNSNGEKHQVTRLEELSSYPDPPPKKPPGPRTLAVGRGTQRTSNAR